MSKVVLQFDQRIAAQPGWKNARPGEAEVDVEDAGMAKIATLTPGEGDPSAMFVRLQSWDDPSERGQDGDPVHPTFDELLGRRVRVTVELLDD